MRNAADTLKHVHLELGGKNAIIVLDDADLELAVEGIVWSAFGTSGQRCTAASRVIAHQSIYDDLQSRLVAAAERLRLGRGWEDETDVGPVINRAAIEKIHAYTAIGIRYGLSSSIFTRDVNKAFRAMRDLEAGITYVNAGTIGAEVHLPFGGTKDTGNGHREAGQAALDVFTEWKSIYVDYSGKLQKAQIDTAS